LQTNIQGKDLDLDKKGNEINSLQTELEQRKSEIETMNVDLQTRNNIIENFKNQLSQNQMSLLEKTKLEESLKEEIQVKTSLVDQLEAEKKSLSFSLNKMKDAIPSSVIMINKDNLITNWNKKAEEIFGFQTGMHNSDISNWDFFNDERITDAGTKLLKHKKPVNVKSVTIKDKQGNRRLTDVTQMPMVDSNGETQGAIMVFDDVSDRVEIQAELERKQQQLDDITTKYQDAYKKLSLVDREIDATNQELKQKKDALEKKTTESNDLNLEIQKQTMSLELKKQELETADNTIQEKTNEVHSLQFSLS